MAEDARNAATKIVLIGAGSAIFTLRMVQDLVYRKEDLTGSTIFLVDIDELKLTKVANIAQQINSQAAAGFKIEYTADRREALQGAEYVILSVEIDRDRLWQLDWEIPLKHGVRHVLGENAGPGGLSHTLRTVPMILEICRDIERFCPQAWVINLTNPESRICLAINKYTNLKVVGLCHGIDEGHYVAAHLLDMVPLAGPWPDKMHKQQDAKRLIELKAAGINHFTWALEIREKATGRDLYPALHGIPENCCPDFHPLTRFLMDATGYMLATGDQHAGELIGFAWEMVGLEGHDFELLARRRGEFSRQLDEASEGETELTPWLNGRSKERVVDVIVALHTGQKSHELSANITNRGYISNLPDDAIVEVPVVVDGAGIHGIQVGELPTMIAAMCLQQIAIQELAVEAAATGNRKVALQALLIDPVVNSQVMAKSVLDELLIVHAENLPNFYA